MADLLSFNPNRGLEFEPGRSLHFDFRRNLEFDMNRNLGFTPGRDLGFGRRGVVFRGFVCPICGALVTEDAKGCSECGARFDERPPTGKPAGKAEAHKPSRPTAPPKVAQTPTKAAPVSAEVTCAYCGVKLKRADLFCWNCGARSTGSGDVVRLPKKQGPPATRDWRGSKGR